MAYSHMNICSRLLVSEQSAVCPGLMTVGDGGRSAYGGWQMCGGQEMVARGALWTAVPLAVSDKRGQMVGGGGSLCWQRHWPSLHSLHANMELFCTACANKS